MFHNKTQFEKCDMTSVNLEEILKYLKIKESLRSENLANYYLCKGIFLFVFIYPEIYYIKHKVKQITELAKTL